VFGLKWFLGGKLEMRIQQTFSPLLHEYKILCIRLTERCQEKNAKIMGLFGMWDGKGILNDG
jgi:hypothetical protein